MNSREWEVQGPRSRKGEGGGSAERRGGNRPRRISRIAGRQRHTATPLGAPPRRLKTLVRASGDVDPSGDFSPPTYPRPASFGGRPLSGPDGYPGPPANGEPR